MKIKEKLRKGNGEIIAFALVVMIISTVSIWMVAFIQLSVALNDITKAAIVTGRSVAVCTSELDAANQGNRVAAASVYSSLIEDVSVEIEHIDGNMEWKAGNYVAVTVSCYVKTIAPYFVSGERYKTVVVAIENGD